MCEEQQIGNTRGRFMFHCRMSCGVFFFIRSRRQTRRLNTARDSSLSVDVSASRKFVQLRISKSIKVCGHRWWWCWRMKWILGKGDDKHWERRHQTILIMMVVCWWCIWLPIMGLLISREKSFLSKNFYYRFLGDFWLNFLILKIIRLFVAVLIVKMTLKKCYKLFTLANLIKLEIRINKVLSSLTISQ